MLHTTPAFLFPRRNVYRFRRACRPVDALQDQFLELRRAPGLDVVAQSAVEHSPLADFDGPEDIVVVVLLRGLRRPLPELRDHIALDVTRELVGVFLVVDGERRDALGDGMLRIDDIDQQVIRPRRMAGEAAAGQVEPGLAVAEAGRRAVECYQSAPFLDKGLDGL